MNWKTDHIARIFRYRRVSLIDVRNTYPAKSRPAVPNMFRTTLNVFIVLPSRPIWRASSMPWLSKRFSPVDCELDGRDPNGHEGITWAATTTPWSDRPVFGKIRYMSFASTTTIRFPEIHRPDRKPREARRSHRLSSRSTLIKVFIPNLCVWEFRCSLRSFTPR
jgi:hypothetical protein